MENVSVVASGQRAASPKMLNNQRPPSKKTAGAQRYGELLLLVHRDVVRRLTGSVRPRGRDGSGLDWACPDPSGEAPDLDLAATPVLTFASLPAS